MLLAFDDTDSPAGGCTTHALFQVLAALPDLAPRGMPRLVRLNPNVPWKTRGNGAVVVELVRPTGPHVVVGEWMGMELRAFPDGTPAEPSHSILDSVVAVLQSVAQDDATPAAVLFDDAPSALHYWGAVRTLVAPDAAKDFLTSAGTLHWATGDGRALIGCLGAAAWPGPAASYEFIAYRERTAWGTPRNVNASPLVGLDRTGITFHTEDPEASALCAIPNTPCPVLLGLRGTDPERLLQTARSTVPLAAQEPLEGWILWATNQASGDHITPIPSLQDASDGMSIRVQATVAASPTTTEGGHVHMSLTDSTKAPFTGLAFEPTKSFRNVVRQLLPGDHVTVTGGYTDGAVRLERMDIESVVPAKISNPRCCDRPMKSRGAGAGYKCPACGDVADEQAAEFDSRADLIGNHEVPIMARRHLHRPASWAPGSAPHVGPDASAPVSAATS